jgi:hypothetical protein
MDKSFIERYTGENVRLTMIDDAVFEGILWYVEFEDETEQTVFSVSLDSSKFKFMTEHIKKIEIVSR